MSARHTNWIGRLKLSLAVGLTSVAFSDGCFDSAIAMRFREAYAPGFTEGITTAITDSANREAGFRQAGGAVIAGVGAVIQPRKP